MRAEVLSTAAPGLSAEFLELSGIFACGIYACAAMSNHYHLVGESLGCRRKLGMSAKAWDTPRKLGTRRFQLENASGKKPLAFPYSSIKFIENLD